jgi:hypothetical protein
VASYRTIGEWVAATFESVRYESAVEAIDAVRALISSEIYWTTRGITWTFGVSR